MNVKSVRTKIAGMAGACLIILSVVLVGMSLYFAKSSRDMVNTRVSSAIETRSLDGLKNLGGYYAGKIQAEFLVALDSARTMANFFAVSKDPNAKSNLKLGRDEINAILLNVLKDNPNFNGTYSCWEPDALDGDDASFRTGMDGNNKDTGRFTPYWNRDQKGNIAVQPLVEYDTMDRHPNGVLKGGWYIGPRENHKESVLGPLPYIVQGKQVWLATLSVPILVNGKFYGVAGTDYNLDFVQRLSQDVDHSLFDGQGEVIITNDEGLIVAESEKPEAVGNHLNTIITKDVQRYLDVIKAAHINASLNENDNTFEVIAPIELGRTGKPWAVIIRVSKDTVLADAIALDSDLNAASKKSSSMQMGIAFITFVVAIFLLWYAAGSVVRPIRNTVDMLRDIAEGEGDLTKRLDIKANDEVGEMATWFNVFMEKLQEIIKQIVSDAGSLNASSMTLTDISTQMATRSVSMAERSRTVASGTEEMSSNMSSVASACEEATTNVNMVATAAEEMTSTITGLAAKSEESRLISESAVTKASDVSDKLGHLGQGAQEISKVTEVISEISEQINLLALNATIEAARAGDYGKGFAVVASEIKDLAKQTAEATQDVKVQIENIQGATAETVAEVGHILEIIKDASNIVSSMTGEMEAQASVTQEIAENIAQTSQGIQEVNENVSQGSVVIGSIAEEIAEVNQSAQEVSDAIGQVSQKADELSSLSQKLQELVGRFRV